MGLNDVDERFHDDEESAGSCLIYECGSHYVGAYYAEESIQFFSHGDTWEECLEDMVPTLNYLPRNLHRIKDGEADLIDVVPLKRGAVDEDADLSKFTDAE